MTNPAAYPTFRSEAMQLKQNLGIMISKMDGVYSNGRFTEAAKTDRLQKLMDEYLIS